MRIKRLAGPGQQRDQAEIELRKRVAQMQAFADELLDHVTEARTALWGGDETTTFNALGFAQSAHVDLGKLL